MANFALHFSVPCAYLQERRRGLASGQIQYDIKVGFGKAFSKIWLGAHSSAASVWGANETPSRLPKIEYNIKINLKRRQS
jgi:hypothetical protein